MGQESKPDAGKSAEPSTKKPYQAPALVKWGSLEDMTGNKSNTGGSDGATKGFNRRTGRGGHYRSQQ